MISKRFRLKLYLHTFQFWRTKVTPSLAKSPLQSTTLYSPVNPKSLDISYPSFSDPPPTPIRPLKIMHVSFHTEHCPSPSQKNCNSPVAYDSDDNFARPSTPPPKCQNSKKQRGNKTKKSKASSISSGDSGWFSSDGNKSLISSSENFDSSCDFGNIPIVNKNSTWKTKYGNDGHESLTTNSLSVSRLSMTSCAVNGESFVVVKSSQNPHEDFKNSMMEMITENKIFEAKDLEELLQSLLSLNSRHHHEAIIQAFSEIWHLMFL
ncbi:Transcription repressor [Heracleum sosnowskyi]|uniref:Transcription repressor n=1 Tax=Heracleum sosnowskyi TaxID=360622 RepID=A0AAD8JNG1_9APIA|nr:Transcription repressor [Heracleum sosnowskyi]